MEFYHKDSTFDDGQIRALLVNIQNVTVQMNNTFEQAILRHQEQFINTYRIKIKELTKLFEELTLVLQDKFINNALTNRLDIVTKERDYFKYECLKLNVQYQTAVNDQNSISSQLINITDEMKIYKHLLENEKLKNKELEKNAEKFKNNFSTLAYKTLNQTYVNMNVNGNGGRNGNRNGSEDYCEKNTKKLEIVTAQLKEKNQIIRNLKIKMSQLEAAMSQKQNDYFEKKQLYETYKICVNAWKRDILTKQRKSLNSQSNPKNKISIWNVEKLTVSSKKDLLKYFFTTSTFLTFIEKLLFNPHFQIKFVEQEQNEENFMIENRKKLLDYMRQKKVISSPFSYKIEK